MSQGTELRAMAERMAQGKDNWDQLCQEIGYFFAPHKADFTDEIYTGEEFADHITNPVPISMARDLGDAFGTMLRSGQWFNVALPNDDLMEDNTIRRWMDYMTGVTRNMLYDRRASFKRMAKEHEHDFATFGGGISSITLNKSLDGFIYRNWHPRDCSYSDNDEGHVDRLARNIKSTARNVYRMFDGRKNVTVPEDVKRSATGNEPDREIKMQHLAIPIDMYDTQTRDFPKDALFASVYIDDEGNIIQEDPEYEFPYVVSRWRTVRTWGAYPFSPATMTALPHARMLQSIMLSYIEAGEKATNPPLIATSDVISSPVDITAGGITWADSEYDERLGQVLRPLDLGKNVPLNERILDGFHQLMADTMYISKLNLPGASSETAYEVSQLIQQNIRQLQPIFEPVEDEIITQYLDRVVSKGLRLGAFGPIEEFPEQLQEQEITYSFRNPLQEERERAKVAQFQEAAQITQAAIQLEPGVAADMEPIQWFRDAIQGTGAPANWLKPIEVAEQIRQQQAEEAAQQQQMQQMAQLAEVAKMGGEAGQAVNAAVAPQEAA